MNLKKMLLQVLIVIFVVYILYLLVQKYYFTSREPFIGHLYRPHIRSFNNLYENFMNNYGPHRIVSKINKWFNY
uniref:Uncharacterized protein n=1 Tax=viral metagenome TaxID=1070528 RepID=A0A6C0IU48_9ZZZZ